MVVTRTDRYRELEEKDRKYDELSRKLQCRYITRGKGCLDSIRKATASYCDR